jgi:MarR family transcriptional regulator, organic hydroperoxide resistance regulator
MNERVPQGGFLIAKIHQVAGRVFNRLLKEHGIGDINSGQGRILFALWQKDEVPISELAAATQLEKSTLTAMLNRLETDGRIERGADPHDRRKTIIRSTAKNHGLEKKYLAVSRTMNEIFYRGLAVKDIEPFEKRLEKILGNLVAVENPGGRNMARTKDVQNGPD